MSGTTPPRLQSLATSPPGAAQPGSPFPPPPPGYTEVLGGRSGFKRCFPRPTFQGEACARVVLPRSRAHHPRHRPGQSCHRKGRGEGDSGRRSGSGPNPGRGAPLGPGRAGAGGGLRGRLSSGPEALLSSSPRLQNKGEIFAPRKKKYRYKKN